VDKYLPQPADIAAFSGHGRVSTTIKAATCSRVSHVGCIANVPQWQLRNLAGCGVLNLSPEKVNAWVEVPLLFESTTLYEKPCEITGKQIQGVQAHNPWSRIAEYHGRVWIYRLTPEWRQTLHERDGHTKLAGHLLAKIGTQYDGRGAVLAGTQIVKHWWAWSKADRSSLFCSEYLAGVLQHVGLFPLSNASKVTPASLIRLLIGAEVYQREPIWSKA